MLKNKLGAFLFARIYRKFHPQISQSEVTEGPIPKHTVQRYISSNKDFPYLISFPRTGSHWLRIMLECYTDQPLLTRTFFNHDNDNYLLLHTHDMDLDIQQRNVIYLYRNPVDVIFSQMKYYEQDVEEKDYVIFWCVRYAVHLSHWLYNENFTKVKTIIEYGELQDNIQDVFKRVCNHLDLTYIPSKVDEIHKYVSKNLVKNKTLYNHKVLNTSSDYNSYKFDFTNRHAELINDILSCISEYTLNNPYQLLKLF